MSCGAVSVMSVPWKMIRPSRGWLRPLIERSVVENLEMGAYQRPKGPEIQEDLDFQKVALVVHQKAVQVFALVDIIQEEVPRLEKW